MLTNKIIITKYYFKQLFKHRINCHFVEKDTMDVWCNGEVLETAVSV
jgi:hypothetical protein